MAGPADPKLPKVCAPLAERARQHFSKADEVMDRNRRRVVRAPRIMSKYYRAILELLVARGFAAPRAPVRLNKAARLAILLRWPALWQRRVHEKAPEKVDSSRETARKPGWTTDTQSVFGEE